MVNTFFYDVLELEALTKIVPTDIQEKERQSWEAECESLREKLEALESARFRSEIESAKFRSKSAPNFLFWFWSNTFIQIFGYSADQLESELSMQNQLLQNKDSDLISAKEEVHFILDLILSKSLYLHWKLSVPTP